MLNKDLKLIKKKYGENMPKLCRELFPTLLETEELLSNLLISSFNPSHTLYDDITQYNLEEDFKNYIYSLIDIEKDNKIKVEKTPKELLDEAGYILYECHSEEEIQHFKKYYAKGEEICTFRGKRLDRCHVFFAVKKDVDNIKREDFDNPKRQDLYGTSVISIQFTRDDNHTLSIKNRYNHTVNNPDSTFSNDLDNIMPGLTESFENEYGMIQKNGKATFQIERFANYIKAKDNRYYKFNYEMNNIYYCSDNIIIDNYEVKKLEKEKYILIDYFILDLKNKNMYLYDNNLEDGFVDSVGSIDKIEVKNNKDEKNIFIKEVDGSIITITLDKENRIIAYKNNSVELINDNFLGRNSSLKIIEMLKVKKIGDRFINRRGSGNNTLEIVKLPSVKEVGDYFLANNFTLKTIDLSNLEYIGNYFLCDNKAITTMKLSNAKIIGNYFLYDSNVTDIELSNVEYIGKYCLYSNRDLTSIECPNIKTIGDYCLRNNSVLTSIDVPKIEKIGIQFLYLNSRFNNLTVEELKKQSKSFHSEENIRRTK